MNSGKIIKYNIDSCELELDGDTNILGSNIPKEYLEQCIKAGYILKIYTNEYENEPGIYIEISDIYIVNLVIRYIDSIEWGIAPNRAVAVDMKITNDHIFIEIVDYMTIFGFKNNRSTGLFGIRDELDIVTNVDIGNILKICINNTIHGTIVKINGKYYSTDKGILQVLS